MKTNLFFHFDTTAYCDSTSIKWKSRARLHRAFNTHRTLRFLLTVLSFSPNGRTLASGW